MLAIGERALRGARRDPEAVIPPILIGAFFFAINVGSLQNLAEQAAPGFDYKAFQLPTAIVLTITGVTRAYALVLDIQNGYFDKLMLSPARRSALLLGHMVADFTPPRLSPSAKKRREETNSRTSSIDPFSSIETIPPKPLICRAATS